MDNIYMRKTITLMKEIQRELNKWKATPCSWIETLNIVKMPVIPNFIYSFSTNLITFQKVILWIFIS